MWDQIRAGGKAVSGHAMASCWENSAPGGFPGALPCLRNVKQPVEGDNNLVFRTEKYQFGQQLRQFSRENCTEAG